MAIIITVDKDGDTRGVAAVDLQSVRDSSSQVASGDYSVIGGGKENTASSYGTTVSGGYNNTASGPVSFSVAAIGGGYGNVASNYYATVAGGGGNTASGDRSSIGGGNVNTASAYATTIGGGKNNTASYYGATVSGGLANTASVGFTPTVSGGYNNTASNVYTTVGGGGANTASGYGSLVSGGQNNVASATFSAIAGGERSIADKHGQRSHAAGRLTSDGDSQTSQFVLRRQTTDATANVEMFLDGSSARMTIASDTTWHFEVLVVARRTNADNESASYRFEGCIDNNAGVTALVGTVNKTVVAEDTAAWDTQVTADDANDSLKIDVTGEAAKNINWVAFVRVVETTG